MELNFEIKDCKDFNKELYNAELVKAKSAANMVINGNGKGNDFLGWVTLPKDIDGDEIARIKSSAERFSKSCDVVIVVGIGGSYLGAKAAIEALSNSLTLLDKSPKSSPTVIYAGHNLSGSYASELKNIIAQYEVGVVVISKSGTTTEPAVAFRMIKEEIENKYGVEESAKRIIAVTDAKRGALKSVADKLGYETYTIADNVGGRFSVLTAVGLLPIAIAGFDIDKMIEGAKMMMDNCFCQSAPTLAESYAAIRNIYYNSGKKIELFATFEPKLQYFAEWWKQLYGESEGKENKGIFPASVVFTTDLHSMGQYIQQGERVVFETFVTVANHDVDTIIKEEEANLDGLNFLAGKSFGEVNMIAQKATMLAHSDGGVPTLEITIGKLDELHLGALIYFYEFACGVSGYMLDVNPFDQPGVEAYKNYMYALLGKPGYEQLKGRFKNSPEFKKQ